MPPLWRPLFRGKGFGLGNGVPELLVAKAWGSHNWLVLEEAISWTSKLSKTSEASWEDTVSGTLKAKGGRVGSPLLCDSSSLTLPPWSGIPLVHFPLPRGPKRVFTPTVMFVAEGAKDRNGIRVYFSRPAREN